MGELEVGELSQKAWLLEALCLVVVLALLAYRVRAARGALVTARQGLGRRIIVRDRAGFRELAFAGEDGEEMLQARVSLADPLTSGIPYTDGLHLGVLAAPRAERALFLGGGPALVPRQFLELYPGIEVSVAEIDPGVVDVAREHFFVAPHPRLSLQVEDGREALSRCAQSSLDVIVVDAFGVGTTPRRLASAPFFALCWARLRPGGCVVVNLAGALEGPESALNRRIYAGMGQAFGAGSVAAFSVPRDDLRPGEEDAIATAHNSIALAQKGAAVKASPALLEQVLLTARARALLPHLSRILARRIAVEPADLEPLGDPADGQSDALQVW